MEAHLPFLAKKQASLPGFVYWKNILAHGDENAFWAAMATQAQPQLTEALARHLFVLANISDRKFDAVNRSIVFAATGGVVACLFVLFTP